MLKEKDIYGILLLMIFQDYLTHLWCTCKVETALLRIASTLFLRRILFLVDTFKRTYACTQTVIHNSRAYPTPLIIVDWPYYGTVEKVCLIMKTSYENWYLKIAFRPILTTKNITAVMFLIDRTFSTSIFG